MNAEHKGNRARIAIVMDEIAAILADVKEKNSMIDAGETHGAEWGSREDDFGEAQQILEEIGPMLDRLDIIL